VCQEVCCLCQFGLPFRLEISWKKQHLESKTLILKRSKKANASYRFLIITWEQNWLFPGFPEWDWAPALNLWVSFWNVLLNEHLHVFSQMGPASQDH
jgi:hypothetical protein